MSCSVPNRRISRGKALLVYTAMRMSSWSTRPSNRMPSGLPAPSNSGMLPKMSMFPAIAQKMALQPGRTSQIASSRESPSGS